jgi:stress response protein YsnF
MTKKQVKRKTYKVWMVVEELTEFTDGTERFKDIEDHTRSVGRFDTIEEANNQMNEVANQYEGDFTKTEGN